MSKCKLHFYPIIVFYRSYESGKVYQKNFEHNQKVFKKRAEWMKKAIIREEEKYRFIETKAKEMMERYTIILYLL